jgi:hypothetical protein
LWAAPAVLPSELQKSAPIANGLADTMASLFAPRLVDTNRAAADVSRHDCSPITAFNL